MTKGHNQGIMNDKWSLFSIMNGIMNNIVNDKNGHNVVNDSLRRREVSYLRNLEVLLSVNF